MRADPEPHQPVVASPRHRPVAGPPGARRELRQDGREETAAREHPALQVPEERLGERPDTVKPPPRLARGSQHVSLEYLDGRLDRRELQLLLRLEMGVE